MRATKTWLFLSVVLLVLAYDNDSTYAQKIKVPVPDVARPLPLSAVRLTGGPLKRAQDLNGEYLLRLEPDRMLAYYRKRAGLEPKAQGYTGWDGDGRNLTGHIAGHYLSGVSMMYAATGDVRFKERADYIVKELKEVQDKNGDGYLGALEGLREKFGEVTAGNIRSSFFDLNGLWSPWYTLHKTFAGLRDCYRYTGNQTALELEAKYAAWAESIMAKLNDEQTQKMLGTEFGGMNEVLADLYADTGDKRWMNLSRRFDHHAFVDPLKRREDKLNGQHGNTQVPKMLGVLKQYIYTGDQSDGVAAEYFWDIVVNHHSFATGGHGKDEYFGPPDQLAERVEGRTDESCNVYNMVKMTRTLFALHPDIKYAEFEERALFNHVLGSIDPEDGRTCYMVPVGRGVRHEYQDMNRSFTCCVGSGMESHGLHGDGIYYEAGDRLYVNLYVPSTATWASVGASLTMDTGFPEGDKASLKVTLQKSKSLTLSFRRPLWAGDGFQILVNGKPFSVTGKPGSYVDVKRTWKTGDTVSLTLPKVLHVEGLPDNKNRAALMLGPLVLAADLGPERRGPGGEPIPSFVTADKQMGEWLQPVPDKLGIFRTVGVPIQWLIGTEGWALFINQPTGAFDLSNKDAKFTPSPNSPLLDLFLVSSKEPTTLMGEYARLTGLPEMPPLWSLGYLQSHRTLSGPEEIMWVARTFREKKLPCDALIYLGTDFTPSGWNTHNGEFTWHPKNFPEPKRMVDDLHHLNFKVVLHTVIEGRRLTGTVNEPCTAAPLPSGRTPDGRWPDDRQVSCYWPVHKQLYDVGIDGWWPDQGDGLDAPSRLARNRMYFEGSQQLRPNERVFALHRNGQAGMQRFAAFLWSGDVYTTWETLQNHVPIAVNTGLSGITYWGTDIGGFVPTKEYTGELHVRWFQFGAFCPLFRAHGRTWHLRLPWGWNTGELGISEVSNYTGGAADPDASELHNAEVEPICRKYLELRYQLMPYLYSIVREGCQTGLPIMRALWLHHSDDSTAVARGDEYLWGRDILVAPVTEKGATQKSVYLPRGVWFDFWTNERLVGGKEISKPVDLSTMPLFVRAGAIVPFGPVKQFTDEKVEGPLTIQIYPGADGDFVLYEDDGKTFNFRRGEWMGLRFRWNDKARQLTVQLEKGSRMLGASTRQLKIRLMPGTETRALAFTGKSMITKL